MKLNILTLRPTSKTPVLCILQTRMSVHRENIFFLQNSKYYISIESLQKIQQNLIKGLLFKNGLVTSYCDLNIKNPGGCSASCWCQTLDISNLFVLKCYLKKFGLRNAKLKQSFYLKTWKKNAPYVFVSSLQKKKNVVRYAKSPLLGLNER